MSAFWGHPLTVAVIGSGIIAVVVQWLTRWWQDQRNAWEIRISLVSQMSETAMDLMARFETALDPESPADNLRRSEKLNEARQEFEVNKAVVHTKLEVYLANPSIAERWECLAEAMTNLVALKLLDTAHDDQHRENRLAGLTKAMKMLLQAERPGDAKDKRDPEEVLQEVRRQLDGLRPVQVDTVDSRLWCDVLKVVLERKRVLVAEVLHASPAFRTSLLPWGSGSVRPTRPTRDRATRKDLQVTNETSGDTRDSNS